MPCGVEPKRDTFATWGTTGLLERCAAMESSIQKLKSLARQSRALSYVVTDRERSQSLESLAQLYERQAAELEGA